jgi:hypothetical protein
VKNCDRSSAGEGRHRGEVEKPRKKSEGLRRYVHSTCWKFGQEFDIKSIGIYRVDWLLDDYIVKGLEKDDKFVATRVRDPAIRERTWVLVTGPK